jgi:hypothetical protein
MMPRYTERDYFIDSEGEYYFMSQASQSNRMTSPVLIKEHQLKDALNDYRHASSSTGAVATPIRAGRSDDDNECICSDALGLHDNVTFMRYHDVRTHTKQWILMLDPQLEEAVRGAQRVRTTVPRRSPWTHTVAHYETVEHADQLMVSFSEPSLRPSDRLDAIQQLTHYNELVTKKGENGTKKFIILKRLSEKQKHRITISLSGQAAQCFTYCQHPSRLVPFFPAHHHHPAHQ